MEQDRLEMDQDLLAVEHDQQAVGTSSAGSWNQKVEVEQK